MSTFSVLRNAIHPPRFICRECRRQMPRTIWDIPEADGSTTCRACDVADAARFAEENAHMRTGTYDHES